MERYEAFQKVGEGSFGSVHKATDRETGDIVAVKVFHNTDEEVVRAAIREARFLSACNHCNITGLREAYRSGSGRIYLVLEYAEHVLSQQLKLHRKGLPGAAVRSIIFQLLQALKYLHDRNIMHRDCKPANILITSEGMVKLCDFGFARYVESGSKPPGEGYIEPLTSYVITRWYRPPEVLVGQSYSTAVDIWAVGCIFAEMVTGIPLFPGASHLDQLYVTIKGLGGLSVTQVAAVKASKRMSAAAAGNTGSKHTYHDGELKGTVFDRLTPHMTRSMMQFLRACLEPDPNHRATADQLLALPYMKEGAWEASAEPQPAPAPAPAPAAVQPFHAQVTAAGQGPSSAPAAQLSAGSARSSWTHVHGGGSGGGDQGSSSSGLQGAGPSSRPEDGQATIAGVTQASAVEQQQARAEVSRKRGPSETGVSAEDTRLQAGGSSKEAGAAASSSPGPMSAPAQQSTPPQAPVSGQVGSISERLPPMMEADGEGDEDTSGYMEVERLSAPGTSAQQPRFSYRARVIIPQGINRAPQQPQHPQSASVFNSNSFGAADEHMAAAPVPARRLSGQFATHPPSLLQRSSQDGDAPLMPRRSLTQSKSKLGPAAASSAVAGQDGPSLEKRLSGPTVTVSPPHGVQRQRGLTSPQTSQPLPHVQNVSPPHIAPHPPKNLISSVQARIIRRWTSTSGAEFAQVTQGSTYPYQRSSFPDEALCEASAGSGTQAQQPREVNSTAAATAAHASSSVHGTQGQAALTGNGVGITAAGITAAGMAAASTAAAITKLSTVGTGAGVGSVGASRVVHMERSCSMPGQAVQAVPRCPAPPAGHAAAGAVATPPMRPNIGGSVVHLRESQCSMDGSGPLLRTDQLPGAVQHQMLLQLGNVRKGASPLHSGMPLHRMHVSPEAGLVSTGPSSLNSSNDGPGQGGTQWGQHNPMAIAAVIGSAGSSSHASNDQPGTWSPTRSSLPDTAWGAQAHSREGSNSGALPEAMVPGPGPHAHSVSCGGSLQQQQAVGVAGPISSGSPASVLSRFGRALSLMGSRSGVVRRAPQHRLSTSSLNLDMH